MALALHGARVPPSHSLASGAGVVLSPLNAGPVPYGTSMNPWCYLLGSTNPEPR